MSENQQNFEQVLSKPYFIEVGNNGCPACEHRRTWVIVGPTPEEQATSTDYGDEEDAQSICDALNDAYQRGATAMKEQCILAASEWSSGAEAAIRALPEGAANA